MGQMITSKIRQKGLKDQHNYLCIAKSVVAISNLADELIKCKNGKNLLGKEYRQAYGSLIKTDKDAIAVLAHTNSQLIHQLTQGMKNKKRLFEKEKTYYSNQKNFKTFLKTLETIVRKRTSNTKATTTRSVARTVASDKRENF